MDQVSYTVEIDFFRTNGYNHPLSDVTERVKNLHWSVGMSGSRDSVARPSTMSLALDNSDGALNPDDKDAPFSGLLTFGALVRVKTTHLGTTRQHYVGKIIKVSSHIGENTLQPEMHLTVADPLGQLSKAEYLPELAQRQRIDTALTNLFDAALVGYPYDTDYFTVGISQLNGPAVLAGDASSYLDFEESATILRWVGDLTGTSKHPAATRFINQWVASEAGGYFWWNPRTEKFSFHSRRRVWSQMSQWTVDSSIAKLGGNTAHYGDSLANIVNLEYTPRSVGTPLSILASATNVPFRLAAGTDRTVSLTYRDPDNPDAKVGGMDVLRPVLGTDLIAWYDTTVDEFDITNLPSNELNASTALSYSVELGGMKTKLVISNPTTNDMIVTTAQVRGTPLTAYQSETVEVLDVDSIAQHGRQREEIVIPILDDAELAEGYANWYLTLNKQPISRLESVAIECGQGDGISDTVREKALGLSIGDVIRVTDDWSKHDREYLIKGETHTVNPESGSHDVRWIIDPAQRIDNPFRLDNSVLDGTDELIF